MCKKLVCFVLVLGCLCILSAPALAVEIPFNMTGGDGMGNSSFNTAGVAPNVWNPAGAPVSGLPANTNVYYTGGNLIRGPAAGLGPFVFAGDTLRIGYSSTGTLANPFNTNGAVNNDSLIFKVNGQTLTVNNLILDAGNVRDGLGGGQTDHLTGNIYVTANGGGFLAQCDSYIDSVISGPGPIYIGDNGSGGADRVIHFTSAASDYKGNIIMAPGGTGNAARSRLDLDDNALMNFAPGLSGVNNSISGTGTVIYNGDFKFDLTGASTTLGDSWTIASATSQTFGGTFTVNGFNDIGGDLWKKSANGTWYQFSESAGTLTVVPEPATMVLLGLGSLALMRRRKS